MNDHDIEKELIDKGLVAKRVRVESIDELVESLEYHFHHFPGTTLIVCVAMLPNGFVVATEESACISVENFNEETGKKIARDKTEKLARNKLWELEGYRLKMEQGLEPEAIAKVCHQINKAYCAALGDNSQPDWLEAPDWQKESAIAGVAFHQANSDAGADASHNSWMAQKEADGWVYGEEKNPGKKEHPCMVPFNCLPVEQQAKDSLFKAIVHELS